MNAYMNNESFNFGVLNGVRGFFTDPSRADDCFIPFNQNTSIYIPINDYTNHNKTTVTIDASEYDNGKDVSSTKVYPIIKQVYNSQGSGYTIVYSASISSDWIITISTSGYASNKTSSTTFLGAVIVFE